MGFVDGRGAGAEDGIWPVVEFVDGHRNRSRMEVLQDIRASIRRKHSAAEERRDGREVL